MKLSPDQILALVRQSLTLIGGFLVTSGTISNDMLNQIIGGLMALTSIIWSLIAKKPVNGVPLANDPLLKLFRRK